ncbi:MAG: glycoside hydrolase family 3 C-terminal domain-containing protein [Lachnospiraceae bacterium]|nr:glycoside hydrolase family 3 C-terminal domain-containing protein [Lachnospiraceae bacterium]
MMNTNEILKEMSLEDKIALCSGANFWETKGLTRYDIPALFMCDGPHGLRKQELEQENGGSGMENPPMQNRLAAMGGPASSIRRGESGQEADMLGIHESVPSTCFPAEALTACSWDPELLKQEAAAIAQEAATLHVGLVLGPGACIKRNPLCGRNFEYFSEDPYLAGKLAAGFIRGAEMKNIGACLKHFAANNQEYHRFISASQMDERTLREIYLPAFEIAVKEGRPSAVMCAYNQVDNVFCASNKRLLTDILRTEWGFDGMVVTDWGALHDRTESFLAGCDLNMPGGSGFGEDFAAAAVQEGTLPEALIDASAGRILDFMQKAAWVQRSSSEVDYEANHALAAKIAAQSIVLLKNEDNILPLAKNSKIALIGSMAEVPRYQGAGSSHINPTRLVSLRDEMPSAVFAVGCKEDGSTNEILLEEAARAAKSSDIAVICAGLPASCESEGFDRENMQMPSGHNRLIEAVVNANPNTVVVLMCGCAVETPWADQVKGILYAGLPGQAGGTAIADVLTGKVNPCGRLAETWPMRYEDCPSAVYYGEGFTHAEYREGIFVGYRYHDRAGVPVRFPFGYGLSYTSFAYSDLHVQGNTVTVTVTNIGRFAGAEVVQMYVCPPKQALVRPVRELKGFTKIFLQPGETKKVQMSLNHRSFAVWNDGWKIQKGKYTVSVGGLSESIGVDGEDIPAPAWQGGSWYETLSGTPSREMLEAMMGRKILSRIIKKGQFTMENTVVEMKPYSLVMRIMYTAMIQVIKKGLPEDVSEDSPEYRMMVASSTDTPLSSVIISSNMNPQIFEGLLEMANGHYLRGIRKLLG